jgi:hypothetical protein
MEMTIADFPVSRRKILRPGVVFRIVRGSGPYVAVTKDPVGLTGTFRAIRLYRDSRRPQRLYCDAQCVASGRTHTIYVDGPTYRPSVNPAFVMRPYRLTLVSPQAIETSTHGRRSPRRRQIVSSRSR